VTTTQSLCEGAQQHKGDQRHGVAATWLLAKMLSSFNMQTTETQAWLVSLTPGAAKCAYACMWHCASRDTPGIDASPMLDSTGTPGNEVPHDY
jgi:hypothetical protein